MNIFKRILFNRGESSKTKKKEVIEEVKTSNFDDSSDNLNVQLVGESDMRESYKPKKRKQQEGKLFEDSGSEEENNNASSFVGLESVKLKTPLQSEESKGESSYGYTDIPEDKLNRSSMLTSRQTLLESKIEVNV